MPKTSKPFDFLLVRHAMAKKRGDIDAVSGLIKAPFKSNSSGNMDTTTQETFELRNTPSGRWLIAARFPKHDWLSVSSNSAGGREILKANKSPRLEFASFGYDDTENRWFFQLWKGGATSFCYELTADSGKATVKGAKPAKAALDDVTDGPGCIKALREYFDLPSTVRTVQESDGDFVVVNEHGRKLAPKICGYCDVSGPALSGKSSRRTKSLEKAIDSGDPDAIRDAIASGASLKQLPDSSLTPLQSALYRAGKRNAEECVRVLLEAGAKIGDMLIEFSAGGFAPKHTIGMLRLLIAHGADVNKKHKYGDTAIFQAVVHGQVEVAELLMEHGADPTVKLPGGSAIEWLERKLAEKHGVGAKKDYARLLEILTGNEVDVPQPEGMSEPLKEETERFRIGLRAKEVIDHFPAKVLVKPQEENRLTKSKSFSTWDSQLREAGFKPAGLYAQSFPLLGDTAVYSHSTLKCDAVLFELFGGSIGCQLIAYANDERFVVINSFDEPNDPDFHPRSLIRRNVVDATVEELTDALASVVAEEQLTLRKTSPKSFLKNYATGYEHIIFEIRDMAASVLETPVIFAGENPARFERLQFFLDLSVWDDPGFSSAKFAESSIASLQRVDVASLESTGHAEDAVRSAFNLLAMRHFQFRGAPTDEALIPKGCEIAAAFVSNLSGVWRRKIDFGMIEELEMALLMCQITKDSKSFQVICDKVPPKMISDDLRGGGDPPLAYGQLLLLIISRFRKRRFKEVEDIEQQIEKGRSKRTRLLLRAWTAVLLQDAEALADSLRASLEHFRSNPDKNVGGNHMPARIAIAESIISNIAAADGMEIHLPTELDDLMMLTGRP